MHLYSIAVVQVTNMNTNDWDSFVLSSVGLDVCNGSQKEETLSGILYCINLDTGNLSSIPIPCNKRQQIPVGKGNQASIAILVSGRVDSIVLAALCHDHVPLDQPIDLINVELQLSIPHWNCLSMLLKLILTMVPCYYPAYSGASIAMAADDNRLVIGGRLGSSYRGHVTVYDYHMMMAPLSGY
jgi:hypothetical protein